MVVTWVKLRAGYRKSALYNSRARLRLQSHVHLNVVERAQDAAFYRAFEQPELDQHGNIHRSMSRPSRRAVSRRLVTHPPP